MLAGYGVGGPVTDDAGRDRKDGGGGSGAVADAAVPDPPEEPGEELSRDPAGVAAATVAVGEAVPDPAADRELAPAVDGPDVGAPDR